MCYAANRSTRDTPRIETLPRVGEAANVEAEMRRSAIPDEKGCIVLCRVRVCSVGISKATNKSVNLNTG